MLSRCCLARLRPGKAGGDAAAPLDGHDRYARLDLDDNSIGAGESIRCFAGAVRRRSTGSNAPECSKSNKVVRDCSRDCRSDRRVLDAQDPLYLFRENLRVRFWSPLRRMIHWLCARRRGGRRRRGRETICRHSRCDKSLAGDQTSWPPQNQSTATRIRSLAPASPSEFVSATAGNRQAFRTPTHPRRSWSPGRVSPTLADTQLDTREQRVHLT